MPTRTRTWRAAFAVAALSLLWPPASGHRRWGYTAAAGTLLVVAASVIAAVEADARWWVTEHEWVVWVAAIVCAAVAVMRCGITGAAFAERIPYQPYMWRWYAAHALAGTLAVASAVPLIATSALLWSAHSAAGDVFADAPAVAPVAVPDTPQSTAPASPEIVSPETTEPVPTSPDTTAPAPTPAPTTQPLEGAELAGPDGRWNVLMLGGDAGPGRWGLRTDTLIVASVDVATGDAALVSVPRNIERAGSRKGRSLTPGRTGSGT